MRLPVSVRLAQRWSDRHQAATVMKAQVIEAWVERWWDEAVAAGDKQPIHREFGSYWVTLSWCVRPSPANDGTQQAYPPTARVYIVTREPAFDVVYRWVERQVGVVRLSKYGHLSIAQTWHPREIDRFHRALVGEIDPRTDRGLSKAEPGDGSITKGLSRTSSL